MPPPLHRIRRRRMLRRGTTAASPVLLGCTATECVHERVGDFAENRVEKGLHCSIGKREVELERNPASPLRQGHELPTSLKPPEGTGNEGDLDEVTRMQRVAGPKGLSNGTPGDFQAGLHFAPLASVHRRAAAPRQKVGVTLDVGHERVHVRGSVRHECTAVDQGHGRRGRRESQWRGRVGDCIDETRCGRIPPRPRHARRR